MALATDKEKIDWLLKRVSTADLKLTLGCFSLSSRLVRHQIASVNC